MKKGVKRPLNKLAGVSPTIPGCLAVVRANKTCMR